MPDAQARFLYLKQVPKCELQNERRSGRFQILLQALWIEEFFPNLLKKGIAVTAYLLPCIKTHGFCWARARGLKKNVKPHIGEIGIKFGVRTR